MKVPDYSYLSTLAECPRRHYYRNILGLRPLGSQWPLVAGKAGHVGLDMLHRGEGIEIAVAEMRSAWGPRDPPSTARASHLNRGAMEIILRHYAEEHLPRFHYTPVTLNAAALAKEGVFYDTSAVEGGVLHLAETPVVVELEAGMPYGGKMDLPVVGASGDHYLIDHKFTSQWVTASWAQRYAASHQFRGYTLMMRLLTGIDFKGVFINGIHMGKNATDDPSKWVGRSSKPFGLFGPYEYTTPQLDETKGWVKAWAGEDRYRQEEMKLAVLRSGPDAPERFWPQNDRACTFCEFAEVCAASPVVRPSILKRHFEEFTPSGFLASGADSD